MSCNKTSGESHGHNWPTNCSGWNGVVDKDLGPFVRTPLGSMGHHLHAYLQNTRFWNMTDSDVRSLARVPSRWRHGLRMLTSCAVGQGLALLFGRLFAPSKTNLTGMAQSYYMEANLAGAPPLPSGVHAIIADFGQLFGTATGAELQRWCRNQSWVLFWAPQTYPM